MLLCLAALCLLVPIVAYPQETNNIDEDVFELSPFVIETTEEGWDATETLAGSRMRTDFKDVANQIEVLTLDFMEDFNMNSIEEAALYTLNVENQEEFVGSGAGKVGVGGGLRIRGLSLGSRTRNFFSSWIPSDNYNLDRVTITSGPNSILFGTGSPGGVINSSLARARFNNFGKMKIQLDDWGGERFQFEVNRELIEDKLAIRVAAVHQNRAFYYQPSKQESQRFYITGLWKPTEKTTVSVHYENYQIRSRRNAQNTPYDEVSVWYRAGDLGSPAYGNQHIFDNSAAWAAGVDYDGDGIIADNEVRQILDNNVFDTSGNGVVMISGQNPANVPVMSWNNSVNIERLDGWGDLIDPVNKDTDGTTLITDEYFPRDVSLNYATELERDRAQSYDIFFNHEIITNLNLEAGYHKELYKDEKFDAMGFRSSLTLQVDPNMYLPDGVTPNPYAGQLYTQGGPGNVMGERERDEWRTALSYEYDFRDHFQSKWLRWAGKHRIAGLLSGREEETWSQEFAYRFTPKYENGRMRDPYFANFPYTVYGNDPFNRQSLSELGANFNANDGDRGVNVRSYILDGGPGYPTLDWELGSPMTITDSNGEAWVVDPMHLATGTNGETLVATRNVNGKKTKFETKQWAYQGFLWDERIVLTYGWREDTLTSADEDEPDVMWVNPETGEEVVATTAGYKAHYQHFGFEELGNEQTGETTLKGIVIHPFRGWDWQLPFGSDISFMYSESNTFQPNANSLNPDGTFQEGEKGTGEDRGVRLTMFDGKFSIKYNEYETTAGPSGLNLPFRRFRFALRPLARDLLQGLAYDVAGSYESFVGRFPNWPLIDQAANPEKVYPFESGAGFDGRNFFNYGDPYGMTANTKAEGQEITVRYSPTKNLDLRLTWNKQEVVQSDIATQWVEFAEGIFEMMENERFVEGYVPGDNESIYHNPAGYDMDGLDLDPNDGLAPGIDYFSWDQIPDGGGNGRNNPNNIARGNMPWGQNDDYVEGGWTRRTIKEQFMQGVYNGNAAIPVMQAYDGRPNDFVRQNRLNLNAMYRFTDGNLKGLSVGASYRWRAAPAIGFGVQDVNGVLVPDTSFIQKGKEEKAVDLNFNYRGKSKWLGNRNYTVRLSVRNAFEGDLYVPKNMDFFTGEVLGLKRVPGRQFIFSFETDI